MTKPVPHPVEAYLHWRDIGRPEKADELVALKEAWDTLAFNSEQLRALEKIISLVWRSGYDDGVESMRGDG